MCAFYFGKQRGLHFPSAPAPQQVGGRCSEVAKKKLAIRILDPEVGMFPL